MSVWLLWQESNGAEHRKDFTSLTEAREHVSGLKDFTNWVICDYEWLRFPNKRPARVIRVLDSSEEA